MQKNKHQDLVLKAIRYIEENLTLPIRVDDVCHQIPLSAWQFQRVFRFHLKTSIGTYLRGRRLTEAFRRLLQQRDSKIVDLAFEFQFESHEGFSRAFKAYFGCLPSEAHSNESLFLFKKNSGLDENQLELIWASVQDILEIGTLGPFHLTGITQDVNSPFSKNDDFESNTMAIWRKFFSETQKTEKSKNFTSLAFGVCLNSKTQLIADKMNYYASKEEKEFTIPPPTFTKFKLPKLNYAQFSIFGELNHVQTLLDYIYGIWLPSSGFNRDDSYDWELFDFKNVQQSGQFSYQYNIPVLKK